MADYDSPLALAALRYRSINSSWLIGSSLFTFLLLPREQHNILRLELPLGVGLQRAQALGAHRLPREALLPFPHVVPLIVGFIKLGGGAPAEVVHTHAHAPHRGAQQVLHTCRGSATVRFY